MILSLLALNYDAKRNTGMTTMALSRSTQGEIDASRCRNWHGYCFINRK